MNRPVYANSLFLQQQWVLLKKEIGLVCGQEM